MIVQVTIPLCHMSSCEQKILCRLLLTSDMPKQLLQLLLFNCLEGGCYHMAYN